MVYVSFVYVYSAGRWCVVASSSSSSSAPTAFGTGLPLMFNSCHVTRLRRTLHPASSCSAVVQLRRVGRCHELSKNPASRESWEGRNFRGDPKKREKKAEGSWESISQLFCWIFGTVEQGTTVNRSNFLQAQRNATMINATPLWNAKNHASRYF